MRMIHLNITSVLPIVDAVTMEYATWLRMSYNEVPTRIAVSWPNPESVRLRFMYHNDERVWTKSLGNDMQIHINHVNGCIGGLELPAVNFNQKLKQAITWILEDRQKLNGVAQRNNYRFIAVVLHVYQEYLFLPGQ
jgi:hypothetical protein